MRKIICTGPESTGKTTLSQQLATLLKTTHCPEFSRIYLEKSNGKYAEKDLLDIAKGQLNMENELAKKANQPLICDTSFLVLKVWSDYKYGRCHPFILEQLEKQKNDVFILCGIDIEWEFDPLRENPNEREELYAIYKKELQNYEFDFLEVVGSQENRLDQTLTFIKNFGKIQLNT